MKNSPLSAIVQYLDHLVPPTSHCDSSLNGLQVESPARDISKIAFAVDSGEMVIEAAISAGAQLLVVHHGLLWGALERITGPFARKISRLMTAGCSLYASHLPLDGSITVGNGAELARVLGFESIEPAFPYKGSPVGVTARLRSPASIDDLVQRARALKGFTEPYLVRAGSDSISSAAIVTGSGAFALDDAKKLGVDLFISGEPKQEVFHNAHELKMSALFLGHYATETVGVLALQREIERQFAISTEFIDIPTGI